MKIDLPEPLPTPYDIAPLPHFPYPYFSVLLPLLALLCGILIIFVLWRRRGLKRIDAHRMLLTQLLTTVLEKKDIATFDLALLTAQLRRSHSNLSDSTQKEALALIQHLEVILYGGDHNIQETQHLIKNFLSRLGET